MVYVILVASVVHFFISIALWKIFLSRSFLQCWIWMFMLFHFDFLSHHTLENPSVLSVFKRFFLPALSDSHSLSLPFSSNIFIWVCVSAPVKWFTLQWRGLSRLALLHAWPHVHSIQCFSIQSLRNCCTSILLYFHKAFLLPTVSLQIYFHVCCQSWLSTSSLSLQWCCVHWRNHTNFCR